MLYFEIGIVVALTLLNGVFSMSELAVVSSRKARLQTMADAGNRGARAALRLIDDPGRFLSTVQIGITLVGVVAGAYGGATLGDRFGVWLDTIPALTGYGRAIGVATVLVGITYLSIVLGELIPKRIALKSPERVASLVAPLMRMLSRVAAPMVWLLGASTDLVLRLLGLHGEREETITEEEVRSMISEGTQAGVFAPAEKEMIDGVLRLADRSVRSIMTPRPDVLWLDLGDPQDLLLAEIKSGSHSRYPVCRGELDELVGVVHTRDLLDDAVHGRPFDLAASATKPLVVHDGTPILKLLDLMKTSGHHLAIVVDEYGSIEGVVTLTDILETIAGDLPEAGEAVEHAAVRREDGSWLVEGWMPVDEFEDTIGLRGLRGTGDFHTVAGLVLHHLGHVPVAGEAFEWDGVRVEVVDMDGRRIDKVLVVPRLDHPAPADE
ncbi:hemolysin family protein [Roseomonas genomospecies 6]|uniref:HlyC/CorC family transporter n=1 Tax=Roseomonas genomospecies 6 TaxID=214106 RepID=A0A9W7U0B5_9PROT|nr:hemolysin family protein [Roseomonas genomospecies 6]KAA0682844.1 HlyC/CorC family transporter [Roseomonas genomospecies 6]